MNDATIIYYTANVIPEFFANNVRDSIIKESRGEIPIISVSHKPIDFGKNICVGDIKISQYNIYKQLLIGAKEADTEFIICCEDDSLYNWEHFNYRPKPGTFAYNLNRWVAYYHIRDARGGFFHRNRAGMCMCICYRDLLIEALEERFAKCPILEETPLQFFGEPGRKENHLGVTVQKIDRFRTEIPTLTFSHAESLGKRRRILESDMLADDLPYWGNGTDLWMRIHRDP